MIGASGQIGEVSLLAKIDTANYKRGAREIDQANRNIGDSAEKHTGRAGAALHKLASVAKVGLLAAGAAAVAFGVTSIKAYSESEDVLAQLNATLKSTKGAAGIMAKAAVDLSKSLQKVTKFSDEQVLSAENLMLTFTSVGKKVFPDATKAALDMSTVLHEDLQSSVIRIGKALQDPVQGMVALRKAGVNVNQAFKDHIKTLVEAGKTEEAQVFILKELQTEFGGSAKAAGQTLSGAIARLKNNFNDGQESIGAYIAKGLTPLANKLADVLVAIDWTAVVNRTTAVIKTLWTVYLVPLIQTIKDVGVAVANYLAPKLEALWSTIINKYWPAIANFAKAFGPTAGAGLVWAIGLAIDAFNTLLTVATPVINWMADHTWVVWGLVGAFAALKTAMFLQGALSAFTAVMAGVQVAMLPAVAQLGLFRGSVVALQLAVATPMIMPAIAIGAALASLFAVRKAAFDAWDAVRNAKNAAESLQESNAAVKSRLQALSLSRDKATRDRAAKALAGLKADGTFASGGFTGIGATNEIAGVVHRGEFVFPKSAVDQSTGLPKAASSKVYVTLNLTGVMARSRSDLREIAKDMIGSVNEQLRARGVAEIGGGNI